MYGFLQMEDIQIEINNLKTKEAPKQLFSPQKRRNPDGPEVLITWAPPLHLPLAFTPCGPFPSLSSSMEAPPSS